MRNILLGLLAFSLFSCGEDTLPKPKAQLRLDYKDAKYGFFDSGCSYQFEVNEMAKVSSKNACSFELHYPKMKATLYLTYKPVNGNIDTLLIDAQKLTYEHVIKADDITTQPYLNYEKRVYGMFSAVGGDAATNAQFYVTDSTKHFVAGSLYFYAKPNYDSILPAVNYVKNDMRHLMETIEWK
ncbi:gliding motility lipoprotein GldD [Flavobacterium chuncheonense]|uniref:Gliding motility lipoprotein GldD n=1 Tax=Flavobacterium chuncheonense TaxID=2026653 RepID=A0ABW5YLX9_9FLAO